MSSIIYLLLFIAPVTLYAVDTPYEELVGRKKRLSAQLDSLEMLKQLRKKQGQNLEELEKSAALVKDSVEAVRDEIAALTPSADVAQPLKTESEGLLRKLGILEPEGLFDWIIVAVGAVAVLSGIILVIGLVHTIAFRPRHRPKHGRMQRTAPQAPVSTAGVKHKQIPARNPTTPTVSRSSADIDTESIESLRQRMHDDSRRIQRFDKGAMPFAAETPESKRHEMIENGGGIRGRVLSAAHEGLDVHEISRRLHISVDQVALILRVARRS
ncbi:MAG: hypothetical protein GF344_15445 [Chitinivibrionales bacterium]|nr:hypothetical protein [Chitinivibrionales bacterium]MBD3358099.1 hypothetical protein [Chitinivibrionales bacterium]